MNATQTNRKWGWSVCIALALAAGEPAAAELPPMVTPSVRQPSRGGFDWQGFVGGLTRGMAERPPMRRPPSETYQPPMVVPDRPMRRPEEPYRPPLVIPGRRPIYRPEYVEPSVATPPTVTPAPNVVRSRVHIPPQESPLAGRISEVSTREAQAYAGELADVISAQLTVALGSIPPDGAHVEAIQKQAATLREMLSAKAPWREIEPVLKELLRGNSTDYPPKVIDAFKRVAQLIVVRDAFLVIAQARPRARAGTLPIAAIPIGVVWILFDPGLAAGTGLLVSDLVVVIGTGGQGELYVGYESVAAALGLPVGHGSPLPNIDEAEAESLKAEIVISHLQDAGANLNYVLNGRFPFVIKPGEKQKLPTDKSWTIEFDRGNNQGIARYGLTSGMYEFRVISERWDLVRPKFDITIDNREGNHDFNYVADNEVVTVKAGETKVHESSEPIIVKFDRGEGAEHAAAKNLNKSGTYKVAVDTQTNYLDLFDVSEETDQASPASERTGG
jgi:hypothetical protein